MVISCSAYGCTNKWSRETSVHFHKFPFRSEKLCFKWAAALKRKNFVPTKASLVCSDHFKPRDYVQKPGQKKKFLKRDAVPSIFNFPVLYGDEDCLERAEELAISSSGQGQKKQMNKKGSRNRKTLDQNALLERPIIFDFENLQNRSDSWISLDDGEFYTNNHNEDDKCVVLGNIWGQRLKLLPLDKRIMVRETINKVFEDACSSTMSRAFVSGMPTGMPTGMPMVAR